MRVIMRMIMRVIMNLMNLIIIIIIFIIIIVIIIIIKKPFYLLEINKRTNKKYICNTLVLTYLHF